jgi:hypothetical protein
VLTTILKCRAYHICNARAGQGGPPFSFFSQREKAHRTQAYMRRSGVKTEAMLLHRLPAQTLAPTRRSYGSWPKDLPHLSNCLRSKYHWLPTKAFRPSMPLRVHVRASFDPPSDIAPHVVQAKTVGCFPSTGAVVRIFTVYRVTSWLLFL